MGNVSFLFFEKEKFYTIEEVSVLSGLPVKEIAARLKKSGLKDLASRTRNQVCEILVPLGVMESFLCEGAGV
ncbi:MAG: hypothetical protein RDV48_14905 [Candidatus Eremiobacteraeota bacterium]|nr:hypothetical protein [Candidatus Eremiobacteraeota bacterium]